MFAFKDHHRRELENVVICLDEEISSHTQQRRKRMEIPMSRCCLFVHTWLLCQKLIIVHRRRGDEERKFSIYVYLICSLPHIPSHTKNIIIIYVSAVLIIEKGKQWLCSTFYTAGFKAFALTDIKAPYFIISPRCKHHIVVRKMNRLLQKSTIN